MFPKEEKIMKLRNFFLVNAVVAVLFGLGFVIIPATVLSWYGVELAPAGLFVSRLYGSALLTFAFISLLVRRLPTSEALLAILLSFFLGDAIGFVLFLIFQLQGIANALGWSTVVIYLQLGLGFGYFYTKA
jgi:hypothetical protein